MAARTTFESYAYAALRIVTGFLFLFHGLQKLFGMYGGQAMPLISRAGAAGMIELVGGVFVMLGLFTSPVAFICSGEMAFAYFLAHAPNGFWPIVNRGELAVFYCFVFLYISARGAGPLSLDRIIRGKKG
ncbi:MAG TPA: DoxX family protein [Vicinamibacterales bacterium]|jgi:putative oxidoreductase|nr:DoxX family protein [Vicinamibacterales bacterium]